MEKVYLIFTVHDVKTVQVDVFGNKEDAIKRIDDYSDAQVRLENSEISDKYSDEFVPQELYQMFWPIGKILYGVTVEGLFQGKKHYTDRFIIEKEVN